MKSRKSIITVALCGCLLAVGLTSWLTTGCSATHPDSTAATAVPPSKPWTRLQVPITDAPAFSSNRAPSAPTTQPPGELWVIERPGATLAAPGTKLSGATGPASPNNPLDNLLGQNLRPQNGGGSSSDGPFDNNDQILPQADEDANGLRSTGQNRQKPQDVSPNVIVYGNVTGAHPFDGESRAGSQAQLQPRYAQALSPQEVKQLQIQAAAEQTARDKNTDNDFQLTNPGCGELIVPNHDGQTNVPVPLDHTDVSAQIQGYIASVHVAQRYRNPFNEKIEAVYVFPLPQDAAVSEFVMTIGDRHIRGIIREKAEAERIYHEARAQGYVASLLTQDRPNIFTQSVANIEPNKQIDINITYFNTMSYVDGSYEFVFPMVVGPRFNPPGSTDGVGAVGRGNQGISGQKTEVQYLKPNERSGHDIALSVDLNAGVPIEKLESTNHKINVKQESPGHAIVTLDPADSIPNKDFVLRYKVGGGQVKSAMFVQRDERGGYFTLMLFPPASLSELPRQPLEMVFTIDVSGSQNGAPLAQEKAATRYCLTNMNPGDTFQIVRFGDTAKTLFPSPVPVTRSNVQEALSYIDGLDAHEGTMLVDGVHASLNFPHDPNRLRFVAFMTDGFIGNESDALREIHNCLGPARIFSFGVGSSTNRYLLDHMATMGNGVAAYLGLNDDADKIMAAYFERISHPALTDISVDFGDMHANEVFPERIGDLFVGRPVVISGRFSGSTPKQVIVHGNVGGEARQIVVPINAENIDTGASHALASVWARTKLADLGDRAIWHADDALPTEMRQVALDYGLVSGYTSFVAVDSLTKTTGDHGTTVAVPVPVPDGVRYETTVQDGANPVPRD